MGGGVCRGASHLPNSLIYKRVPQIAVCEQSKSEKLGILCIFGQRNSLKFRKGSSFVRFAPSEAKKKKKKKKNSRILAKMPTFRKSGRDPLLKNLHPPQIKILGMGLVEASQMHRLRKQGGLGELSPLNILSGGVGVSFSTPKKNPISLQFRLKKGLKLCIYLADQIQIFLGKGALPPCNPHILIY